MARDRAPPARQLEAAECILSIRVMRTSSLAVLLYAPLLPPTVTRTAFLLVFEIMYTSVTVTVPVTVSESVAVAEASMANQDSDRLPPAWSSPPASRADSLRVGCARKGLRLAAPLLAAQAAGPRTGFKFDPQAGHGVGVSESPRLRSGSYPPRARARTA